MARRYYGMEFRKTSTEECLDDEVITHEFVAAYISQHNGVVERKNHTLIKLENTASFSNNIYFHKLLII
jgi:hypothetical protein